MIKYLRHTEIDKVKWDNCLQSSPYGIVYAASWYLDIVSPGWEALVEDDYQNIFPLCARKKWGFNYLFQPFFTQQGGIFSRETKISTEKIKEFLASIPAKFKLTEINLNSSNEVADFDKYKVYPRRTHHLTLNSPIEKLRENYSENLKRNLKKSKQVTQKLESSSDIKSVIKLFRAERGKEIDQLGDQEYLLLEKIVEEGLKRNLIEILISKSKSGEVTAGAVFLISYSSFIFLFSATGSEARASGSMSLIIDQFIEKHQQENKLLDFEGSMDDQLSRFYRSYGSQEIVYLQIRKNNLPIPFRWFK